MNAHKTLPVVKQLTHRICLVTIYIGSLPKWIPVWLRSCELNPEIDFLLLTNEPENVPYRPANVRVEPTSLAELKSRFSKATGVEVAFNHGYKACDLKPAYGVGLADLLEGYDFWGHTDLDIVYGNLAGYIRDEWLNTYVRLYRRGHLSLYRNSAEGNNLYRLPHPDVDYRRAFRSDRACYFDETGGIEPIMRFYNIPEYVNNHAFADVLPRFATFRLTRHELNRSSQIFIFENGHIFQLFKAEGEVRRREFMYLHLQKRHLPAVDPEVWRTLSSWICTPQGFVAGTPSRWNTKDLHRYNRPNFTHALRYGLIRASRRLNPRDSQRTT